MPRHLAQVLAQHEFQEAFKNYRDLRFLTRNLDDWKEQARRLRRHAGDPPQGLSPTPAAGPARVPATPASSAGEAPRGRRRRVARGEAAGRRRGLRRPKELDLLERVETLQSAIEAPGADAEIAALRDRVRLAAGAPSWQLAKDQPVRAWDPQKEMQRIDAELVEITAARRRAPRGAERRAGPLRPLRPAIAALTRCSTS